MVTASAEFLGARPRCDQFRLEASALQGDEECPDIAFAALVDVRAAVCQDGYGVPLSIHQLEEAFGNRPVAQKRRKNMGLKKDAAGRREDSVDRPAPQIRSIEPGYGSHLVVRPQDRPARIGYQDQTRQFIGEDHKASSFRRIASSEPR